MEQKTLLISLFGALVVLGCQMQPAKQQATPEASAPAAPQPKADPEGTWENTTETLMTRTCKWVRDRKEGDRLREERADMYREALRGSSLEDELPSTLASGVQDPVVERCRKVKIKSPKAAERYVYRKLWSDNNYKRQHGVECYGEYKESPKNDALFMVREINKRPGACSYMVFQERERAETGEPTKQELELTHSDLGEFWILQRRLFTPSASWMD